MQKLLGWREIKERHLFALQTRARLYLHHIIVSHKNKKKILPRSSSTTNRFRMMRRGIKTEVLEQNIMKLFKF